MKKRTRLNKKGKVLVTTIVIALSLWIYELVKANGHLVTQSNFYLSLIVIGYIWLLAGQFITYSMIWGDK